MKSPVAKRWTRVRVQQARGRLPFGTRAGAPSSCKRGVGAHHLLAYDFAELIKMTIFTKQTPFLLRILGTKQIVTPQVIEQGKVIHLAQ